MTSTASQLASACETAARVISGAAIKPRRTEQEMLIQKLREAAAELRNRDQ